jgi:methionyl-tRNA formyltransferase
MKLLLMADGSVGHAIANFLMRNYPDDIALLVTSELNEISRLAEKNGIPAMVYSSDDELLSQLDKGVDLGVLAWWPSLLKPQILDVPKLGFVNTHPSLLPHNRGKHFNFWALVEQAPFGVTLHRVDEGIDSGDILAQSAIDYGWCDTAETLYIKAQNEMVKLFTTHYPVLRAGNLAGLPQSADEGSFHLASEIEPASRLDLEGSYRCRDLLNLLRARTFDAYPGCWFEDSGRQYEVAISIRERAK